MAYLREILLKTRQDDEDRGVGERKGMLIYLRALLYHGNQFCFDLQFYTLLYRS